MFDILLPLSCSLVEGTGHLTLRLCSPGCTTPHTLDGDYPGRYHNGSTASAGTNAATLIEPRSSADVRTASCPSYKICIAKPAKNGKNGSTTAPPSKHKKVCTIRVDFDAVTSLLFHNPHQSDSDRLELWGRFLSATFIKRRTGEGGTVARVHQRVRSTHAEGVEG